MITGFPHRAAVKAVLATAIAALAINAVNPAPRRAHAAESCVGGGLYDQTAERGRTPAPDRSGHVYPIVTIHGITGTDAAFTGTVDLSYGEANPKPPRSLMDLLAGPKQSGQALPPGLPAVHVYSYSYTDNSLRWIDDPSVGEKFGRAIDCLYAQYGVPVSVVAHSMGGLATRWVANSNDPLGFPRAPKLGKVITFGTPYLGSLFASVFSGAIDVAEKAPEIGPAVRLLTYLCGDYGTAHRDGGPCGPLGSLTSQAGQALRRGSPNIAALARWPAGPSVATLAGSIRVPLNLIGSPLNTSVDLGDVIVETASATADPLPARTIDCRYDTPLTTEWTALKRVLGRASPEERHAQLTNLLTGGPCYHGHLMRNVELTNEMLGQLSDWLAARALPPVAISQLVSAPVPSLCEHPAGQLVDGSLPGIPEIDGSVSIEMVDPPPMITDLNDDGTDELVAVANCNRGGVGWPNSLLVYGSGLTFLDEFKLADLGDRVPDYESDRGGARVLAVRNGQLQTGWTGQREGDLGAGGSLPINVELDFNGREFVVVKAVQLDETKLLTAAIAAANGRDARALVALGIDPVVADGMVFSVEQAGPLGTYECTGEVHVGNIPWVHTDARSCQLNHANGTKAWAYLNVTDNRHPGSIDDVTWALDSFSSEVLETGD
ncbi:MAG: hypothetical protein ABIP21_09105 [Acidimicrobiia bacterium]